MSNCFSLASAEPFFNLLTASKQEEERRRMKESEREEGVKRYEINEHLEFLVLLGYSAKLGKYARREQWEAETLDEEASSILPFLSFFFSFFPLSQELLRLRAVPGELQTNGGWHHDRTLHQSLQRLFGYLPGLRKNCYSFCFILPGNVRTLSTSLDIEIVIGHVLRVSVCAWARQSAAIFNFFFTLANWGYLVDI